MIEVNPHLKCIFTEILNRMVHYLDTSILSSKKVDLKNMEKYPKLYLNSLQKENSTIRKQKSKKKKNNSNKKLNLENLEFLKRNQLINNDPIHNKNELHSLNSQINAVSVKEDTLSLVENLNLKRQKVFYESKREGKEIDNDVEPNALLVQPDDLDIDICEDVKIIIIRNILIYRCITLST